jgi:hypothetical protein
VGVVVGVVVREGVEVGAAVAVGLDEGVGRTIAVAAEVTVG